MRWRIVPSDSSRLATSACSASAVPIRSSTDGSSRRTSTETSSARSASAIVGTTVLPSRASASAASSASSWRPSARIRTGASSSRTRRWAARMACRATSALSSAMSGGRRSANVASWIAPIRRAASARSRCPSGPPLCAMPSTMSRAASRFWAGPGAERNAAAPALIEKSWKSPELLDLAQRVDAGLTGEIQQRLGADADVRVAQHGRDALGDRVVAAGAEGGQRTPADVGIGMRQQRAQRRMPLARLLPFDEIERVADLGQIGGGELRREHVGRGAFGHRRGAALRVETMPVNAVLNGADVLRPHPPRQRQPDADGHEIDRRRAAQIEVQAGQHEEALASAARAAPRRRRRRRD